MPTQDEQRALERIGYKFSFGMFGWSVYYKGEKLIRITGRKSQDEDRQTAVGIATADRERRGL